MNKIISTLSQRNIRYRIAKHLAFRSPGNTPSVQPYASPVPDDHAFIELGGPTDFTRRDFDAVLSELATSGFIDRYPIGAIYKQQNGGAQTMTYNCILIKDDDAYQRLRKRYKYQVKAVQAADSLSKNLLTILAVVFGAIVTAFASNYIDRKFPKAEDEVAIEKLEERVKQLENSANASNAPTPPAQQNN